MGKAREIDEVTPNFASLFTPEVVADMKKKFGPDFLDFDKEPRPLTDDDIKQSREFMEKIQEDTDKHVTSWKEMYTTGLSPSGRKLTKSELFNIKLDYERRTGEKLEWIYASEEDNARFDALEIEIDEEHRQHIDYLKNLYLTGKTLEGRSLSKFELFDIKKRYEQLTGEELEWIYD